MIKITKKDMVEILRSYGCFNTYNMRKLSDEQIAKLYTYKELKTEWHNCRYERSY